MNRIMNKKLSLCVPGKFRIKIEIENWKDYLLSRSIKELLREKDDDEDYENNTIMIDAQFLDKLLKE
jgi:hypothetical protein